MIVVSIGANDVINSAVKFILDYAADNNLLAEGKTADDIPENPTRIDAEQLLDQEALKKYLLGDPLKATRLSTKIKQYLIGTSSNPTGTIQTQTIPDTEAIIEKLQTLNPDADIIIQTVYHPLQFSQEYWNNTIVNKATSNELLAIKLCRNILIDIMNAYQNEIISLSSEYSIKTADIYSEFTSIPVNSQDINNQGYSYYFTNVQTSGDDRDIHPNQKGHLAIAAAVLEQIGQLHDTASTSLLRQVFASSVSDISEYPSMAYDTYLTVAGNEIQPVVTTTTTTTTTSTSTTTQTSTTSTSATTQTSTTSASTTTQTSTTSASTTTQTSTTSTSTTTQTSTTSASTTSTSATTSTVPVTTKTAITTEPIETYNFGDVDKNGTIDALDASIILMEYAATATNSAPILNAAGRIAADVNKDGAVDALDASVVLTYYAYTATGGKLSLTDFLSQ